MHQDDDTTEISAVQVAIPRGSKWLARNEPATGRHDARDSVRVAAVAGKLSHRTDRAARRGLRGRGERR